ncbi:hypothetical protein J6O48_04820 [bacterium]|nr:hypothetical protein [bacterium]
MKVQPISQNIIVTTSRKGCPTFGADTKEPIKKDTNVEKQSIKNIIEKNKKPIDAETKYNTIGVIAGASFLALVGVALVNLESGMKFFNSGKKNLKSYLIPHVSVKRVLGVHGGPTFNPMLGPKYIDIGWTEYIQGINKKIKSHNKIDKCYQELFTNSVERLNELESLAKKRVINRGGKWE